jgi:hypothetical protein
MDHAAVAELQAVASTLLPCRSRDRDASPPGSSGGHCFQPSSDVGGIAGSEMRAEERWITAPIHWVKT